MNDVGTRRSFGGFYVPFSVPQFAPMTFVGTVAVLRRQVQHGPNRARLCHDMQHEPHLKHLQRAIDLADEAVSEGNHPFGAVLVSATGEVLMEGKNSHSVDRGPGHAEANLAREAARAFDIETLRAATLYTSVEPCSMCSGTIYWAEIGAVVFGMTEQRLGEMTGDNPENPTQDLDCRTIFASGRRPVAVRGPFPELQDRIVAQHKGFWSRNVQP